VVDPVSFIDRLCGTFNSILNVMGNSRHDISALHLIETYRLTSKLLFWKKMLVFDMLEKCRKESMFALTDKKA